MTELRPSRFGPTWRTPQPPKLDEERAEVYCSCGVEMRFRWPAGREKVHCFGCGEPYPRPPQFMARSPLIWRPPAPETPSARVRSWLARHWELLALLILAAILLGVGVRLL